MKKRYKTPRQHLAAEKKFESDFRTSRIQFNLHLILQRSFQHAVEQVESAAIHNPTDILTEFNRAFDPCRVALGLKRDLEESGHRIESRKPWLDPKWFNITKEDLFNALKSETQELLKKAAGL